MPIDRLDVCREAESWVGTPFRHQGRMKGVGVDCAGLVIEVAKVFWPCVRDYRAYTRQPCPVLFLRLLDEALIQLPAVGAALPADVLVFAFDGATPRHLGILLPDSRIVHAYERAGRCVAHRMADVWRARCVRAYRFPFLEDC